MQECGCTSHKGKGCFSGLDVHHTGAQLLQCHSCSGGILKGGKVTHATSHDYKRSSVETWRRTLAPSSTVGRHMLSWKFLPMNRNGLHPSHRIYILYIYVHVYPFVPFIPYISYTYILVPLIPRCEPPHHKQQLSLSVSNRKRRTTELCNQWRAVHLPAPPVRDVPQGVVLRVAGQAGVVRLQAHTHHTARTALDKQARTGGQ